MGNRHRMQRRGTDPGAGIRALRLEQLFREELSSILDGELSDQRFDGVRVTLVELSRDLLVTRKGAIRAGAGELGIIPGSMGAQSFIVRGLGNPQSFESASHGAGRRMSRHQARKAFTQKDLARQSEGVECREDSGIIDEAPKAYKDIRLVMEQQQDLVEIVATLKQVVCVKG